MRRASLMAVAATALASMCFVVARGRGNSRELSCKPQAPIELQLTLLEENRSEGFFRVAVESSSKAELPAVTVRARLTGDGRVVQGMESRRVSLGRDKALRDQWAIRTAPGRGETLIVTAESRVEGAVLSRSAVLDLGDVQRQKASIHVRTDAHGRRFAEVRAKSAGESSP